MGRARLGVGLAGLGTMGRNHLRNLCARDDVTLVAVADPSAHALAAAGAQAPLARRFRDPMTMLAQEALDALIIAAPTTLHFPLAMEALHAGVAVLVEKPLAATVQEGRELVHAADATGVLLQVGHIERFNPAVQALARRLADGALSRIYSIRTVRAGPLPARTRDVGVAVDLATHDVDIICSLLGERPVRAYGEVTRRVHTAHEDLLYGLLAFPGGALGQLDVNWLTPEKQRSLAVLGAEGMFRLDYLRQSLTFTRATGEPAPTYLEGYAPIFAGDTASLPVRPAEPLSRQLDAFFSAIRSGGPSPVSAADGLWAVALAELLLTSAAQGRPIPVEPSELA